MENDIGKLYSSGIKLLGQLSPQQTFEIFTNEALKLVHAEYGSVFLVEKGKLKRVYASSPKLFSIHPRPSGLTKKALSARNPFVSDAKYSQKKVRELGIRSIISIPLSYHENPVGLLTLLSSKRPQFSSNELKLLRLLGLVASFAIAKSVLNQSLKNALDIRDLFISLASHELKTPLTAISIYSEFLKEKIDNGVPDKKIVIALAGEVKRLKRLVNELMQIENIEKGILSYSFAKCHLREVIFNAISSFQASYMTHQVVFSDALGKNDDITIGDNDKLFQVIINILNNAGKFSPKESQVIINLSLSNSYVIVTIKDQGQGIAKKKLGEVFSKFYKGESKQEGLGIGLFLAKNIISQHKGNISISSKLKKGTTVTISLPHISNV